MPMIVGGAMIGSALIGGVGSYMSGQSSAAAAERNYKHRYQWQVKDLQKAGLNPMLSYSQAAPNVPQPNFPDVGSAAVEAGARGASAASAIRLQKTQQDNVQAQTNKTMAEGKAVEMQNLITESSPQYQSAKSTLGERGEVTGPSAVASERWKAELRQIQATADKTVADTDVSRLNADLARGDLNLKQIQLRYADELAKVEVAYKAAMSKAAQAGVPAAQADAAFWQSAGDLGRWAAFIKSLMK